MHTSFFAHLQQGKFLAHQRFCYWWRPFLCEVSISTMPCHVAKSRKAKPFSIPRLHGIPFGDAFNSFNRQMRASFSSLNGKWIPFAAFYLKTVNVLGSNTTKSVSQYAAHSELLEERLSTLSDWMPPNSKFGHFRILKPTIDKSWSDIFFRKCCRLFWLKSTLSTYSTSTFLAS